jgi:hypothetical protein
MVGRLWWFMLALLMLSLPFSGIAAYQAHIDGAQSDAVLKLGRVFVLCVLLFLMRDMRRA